LPELLMHISEVVAHVNFFNHGMLLEIMPFQL
jgi:hypothetical protein